MSGRPWSPARLPPTNIREASTFLPDLTQAMNNLRSAREALRQNPPFTESADRHLQAVGEALARVMETLRRPGTHLPPPPWTERIR